MAPKYDDHLPLYRQAEIFAGAGVSLEDLDPVRLGRGDPGDAAAAGRRPRYRRPGQRHHYMRSTPQGDPYLDFSSLTRDQTAALAEGDRRPPRPLRDGDILPRNSPLTF